LISGSPVAYRDNGYRAVYSVTMSQAGPAGVQAATQSVVVYDDESAAQRALTDVLNMMQLCGERNPAVAESQLTLTEVDGGESDWWTSQVVGPTSSGDPTNPTDLNARRDTYYLVNNTRVRPYNPSGTTYWDVRSIGAKGNVVVDIAVRGIGIEFQHHAIIARILRNLG
jgi:hypothetical protein